MIKEGWINKCSDKVDQLREVLNFFGVASPNRWDEVIGVPVAAFRISTAFEIDKGALTAWLRKGEIEAQRLQCRPFDRGAFRQVLNEARSLTRRPLYEVFPDLQKWCARAGIAVVVVPELPKMRANGATRWLSKDKALIQLSLRYKREDVLWFTFFHEAGHILLHGKRQVFVDSGKFTGEVEEEQANRFAADLLIPKKQLKRFIAEDAFSEPEVVRFAHGVGIDPGIVVGRLQNDKRIKHSHLNGLRRAIDPEAFAEAVQFQSYP